MNTQTLVTQVSNAAFNAQLIGVELTPAYVAYYCGVSQRFATFMIQYWQGAGSPVAAE